jgi:hypothetical protein
MDLRDPLNYECRWELARPLSHVYYQLADASFCPTAACGHPASSPNPGTKDPDHDPTCPACLADLTAKRAQGL